MKIVFMGTPDFAAGILNAIVKAGYDVVGVVTQPDKPKGRRKEPVACPVKEVALREGLRVYQPQRVRNPEAVSEIESMGADLIVVAAFGQSSAASTCMHRSSRRTEGLHPFSSPYLTAAV